MHPIDRTIADGRWEARGTSASFAWVMAYPEAKHFRI
jgi:hypothetical protein